MKQRGFTVVELVIVMAIMGILLAIGVASFRGFQANARDEERKADIQALANYLESIYGKEIKNRDGVIIKSAGSYPALSSAEELQYIFADVSPEVLTPPQIDQRQTTPSVPSRPVRISSITAQSNQYIYAPSTNGYTLCAKSAGQTDNSNCRQFTLIYKLETVPGKQTVGSKHR